MKLDLISSAFWLLISIAATTESYHLGLGSLRKPGSGLLPFVASCFLGLFSVVVFLQAQLGKPKPEEKIWPNRDGWLKVILVFLILLAYALALEKIGFVLDTFLLIFILLKTIEPQSWIKSIAFSLLVTVSSYITFNVWLKVPLPSGLLGLIGF